MGLEDVNAIKEIKAILNENRSGFYNEQAGDIAQSNEHVVQYDEPVDIEGLTALGRKILDEHGPALRLQIFADHHRRITGQSSYYP
ncbi:hypothetical protein KW805_02055 [Candidatus Pacearchaeota archaeon]|nr:hypothetical protein [Candidatus Pacearchaeota archaeon]